MPYLTPRSSLTALNLEWGGYYLVPTALLVADHLIDVFAPATRYDDVVITAGFIDARAELAVGVAQAGCHARRVDTVGCRGGGGILSERAAHSGEENGCEGETVHSSLILLTMAEKKKNPDNTGTVRATEGMYIKRVVHRCQFKNYMVTFASMSLYGLGHSFLHTLH